MVFSLQYETLQADQKSKTIVDITRGRVCILIETDCNNVVNGICFRSRETECSE